MRGHTWVHDPDSGDRSIPPAVRQETERRIRAHAQKHYAGRYSRLDIRFRGSLCYIDAFVEPTEPSRYELRVLRETREQYFKRLREVPIHLCRLRYFGNENAWSLSFFTYSNERYEPCVFHNGSFRGTPEEAFDVGAAYL
jgi:hypothetical protein